MTPDIIDEALRYLGVHSPADDLRPRLEAMLAQCRQEHALRWRWRHEPLCRVDGVLHAGAVPLPGASAERMLKTCSSAALLVCTLGPAFELQMQRLQKRSMADAVMMDALGSALVEEGCDAAEREIALRFPGLYLTDRFSPGYGDLPMNVQTALLDTLDAGRSVGVQLLPSLLMSPQKSVTAIIGLSEEPQSARIRGCAFCRMAASCPLRREGHPCRR